jgi:hypothetical protein
MVASFVLLIGKEVSEVGRGEDSMNVSLSRGRVERSEEGKSVGEHATRRCRRWVEEV